MVKNEEEINLIPAKPKKPLSKNSTQRIKLTFQNSRLENKSFKEKILELQK